VIALLSNVTVESLASRAGKETGEAVFTAPGFDTWRTELLHPSSAVWDAGVKTIYLLLHGPALFPDGPGPNFPDVLAEPLDILSRARAEHQDKIFVVSTLDLPSLPTLPLTGRDFGLAAAARWRDELERAGVPVLGLAELAAEAGRERFYSARMWYFGSLPFSQRGENLLAREISRVENALRKGRRKCLVLDLDNTLWGGVVGEDGVEGISLSSAGPGSQYRDVQRVAGALSKQGVLLAAASKNNPEDALRPFREHPHMALREDDFVSFKADWNPKPANIEAIARELNIGLDSLVFIDDNPVEREAVRAALPEVAVPDFPGDSAGLPAFMAEVARTYFTAARVGGEDLEKTEMYRAEARRGAERSAHLSLDDYLASLEMKLDLHRLRPDEIARASQLSQKTNQFNLTTKRCTEADMTAALGDPRARVWMAALRDRFGDYGRIALVSARLTPSDSRAAIDSFLMSCRVMGRGVEEAILSGVERALAGEGVTEIRGEYRWTAKNASVRDFWARMGYEPKIAEEARMARVEGKEDGDSQGTEALERGLEREPNEQESGRGGSVWVLRAPCRERNTKVCPSS
jgi:FkbH-like protein